MLKKPCSWGFPRFLPVDVGVRVQHENPAIGGGVIVEPSRTRSDGAQEVLILFDEAPVGIDGQPEENPLWEPTCYLRLETVTSSGERYEHGAKEAR